VQQREIENNFTFNIVDGVSVITGDLFNAMQSIDSGILKICREQKIQEISLPSTIGKETLPSHIEETGICVQTHDNNILSHAACLPIYQFKSRTIIDDIEIYTAQVRCFRNEENYNWPRLKEFNVREIIFLGTEANIKQASDKFIAQIIKYFNDARIHFSIEQATDSFLDQKSKLATFQRLMNVKMEFTFSNQTSKFAIGSINKHHNYFSSKWQFKTKHEVAHTMCIGIGLERAATAMLLSR